MRRRLRTEVLLQTPAASRPAVSRIRAGRLEIPMLAGMLACFPFGAGATGQANTHKIGLPEQPNRLRTRKLCVTRAKERPDKEALAAKSKPNLVLQHWL